MLEGEIGIPLTLEEIISHPDCFGLTTMTPAQRAICRAVQGLDIGDLWDDTRSYDEAIPAHPSYEGYYFSQVELDQNVEEDRKAIDMIEPFTADTTVKGVLRKIFGGVKPVPGEQPTEICLTAAIRTFKSLLAAAIALVASQTVDLSPALEEGGELPRYSALSLEIDNAKDIHRHLVAVLKRPALRHLTMTEKEIARSGDEKWHAIVRESRSYTVGSTFMRHPSGRLVEIRVVAGKRAGGSLVSKWSIGCTFDESPRMTGADESVINLDHMRSAVLGRLLPGAQIFMCGSPWAPFGPVYEMMENELGSPIEDRLVMSATGPALNPYWWTPARCEKLRKKDPTTFCTDVLARFAEAAMMLFPPDLLDSCSRPTADDIPYDSKREYAAAIDPATRGNAWTLVIADRFENKKRIVACRDWVGTTLNPLNPRLVMIDVYHLLRTYGLSWALTDEWAADALREIAWQVGFSLIEEPLRMTQQVRLYMGLAAEMADGQVEIPSDPVLKKDLKNVRKRPTQKGATIALLKTPDGRHADYAPACMRVLKRFLAEPEDEPPPPGTPERANWDDEQQALAEIKEQQLQSQQEFWEDDESEEGWWQ